MNSTNGEAPVIGPTEASVSNPTSHGKTDMNNFNASTSSLATEEPLTTVTTSATTAKTALVPVFTGIMQGQAVQLCDARTLHTFMAVLRDFTTWIKGRIRKFGFVEGIDFIAVKNLSSPDLVSAKSRAQTLTDYHLTLDMAKELSMVENNAKGREARRYFIDCEKQAVTRPMLVSTPFTVLPNKTLSAAQADTLRDLLADFAGSMPLDLRGLILREGWSKLKSHFNTDYRHIPASEFNEAISIISRHIAKWAPSDPMKKELALPSNQVSQTLQLMLVTTTNGVSTVELLPAEALPEIIMQKDGVISTDQVQKIALHSNLRMMGEVLKLKAKTKVQSICKALNELSAFELMEVISSGHGEMATRTALPGRLI